MNTAVRVGKMSTGSDGEGRVSLELLVSLGKTATQVFLLRRIEWYGDERLSRARVFERFKET